MTWTREMLLRVLHTGIGQLTEQIDPRLEQAKKSNETELNVPLPHFLNWELVRPELLKLLVEYYNNKEYSSTLLYWKGDKKDILKITWGKEEKSNNKIKLKQLLEA